MTTTPSRRRKIFLPALVILIFLVLVTVGFRVIRHAVGRAGDGFFRPYLNVTKLSRTKLRDRSLLACDKEQLAVLVEQLRSTNRDLALNNATASALLEENRQLRRYLNLSRPAQWRHFVAEVTLRDPLRFDETFTIGKGSCDGIAAGDAVAHLNPDGRLVLVGVIDSCGAHSSKVITVINPELRVSGRVAGNCAIGFTNSGSLHPAPKTVRFGMLPLRDDYVSGEVVTTTGYETGIPEGLKIGEMGTIRFAPVPTSGIPDFNCELIPAVPFHSLRFVVVLHRVTGENE